MVEDKSRCSTFSGHFFNYDVEKKGVRGLTTVVIPSYNADSTIERAVVSALTQDTDRSYNVVVVDDGSENPVMNSLESLFMDPRVSVLRQSNAGASMAMNLGGLFSGRYIIRLDADDELLPRAVQVLTDHMESDQRHSYAYSDGYWVGLLQGWDWENFSPVDSGKMVNPWIKRKFDSDELLRGMYFGHARIFRTDKFLEVGGYDSQLRTGQDWDFALKMSEVGEIRKVPEKLHKYYLLETGLTNTHSDVRQKANKMIVKNAIDRRGLTFDQVPGDIRDRFGLVSSDFELEG